MTGFNFSQELQALDDEVEKLNQSRALIMDTFSQVLQDFHLV
jgi:hypothetical protein